LKTNDTYWLSVLGEAQLAFILFSMVVFMTIPKQGRKDFLELGLIILLPSLTETIADIGYHFFQVPGNVVVNIYHILNLPLVALLYRKKIHWKNRNVVAYTLISLFLVFALVNFFFVQGIHTFNSFTSTLAAVTTIIISISYFYALIQQLPTQSITTLPMFWINSAMLIYRSGTFFVYLSADYLINVLQNKLIAYWFVTHSLGLVFYAMLCYSMYLIRQQYLVVRDTVTVNE
jgi:hypothetical protein